MTIRESPHSAVEQLKHWIESTDTGKHRARELSEIWNSRSADQSGWSTSPEPYSNLAQRFLKLGFTGLAEEVANTGLNLISQLSKTGHRRCFAAHITLLQTRALALSRNGSPGAANQIGLQLQKQGCKDQETLGILASTTKVMALASLDSRQRRRKLRKSLAYYEQAYQGKTSHYWTGINVAVLRTLLDDAEGGADTAEQVHRQCKKRLKRAEHNEIYWLRATIGEAALILGNIGAAEDSYRSAYAINSKAYGDLNSTRRQLRLLLAHFDMDELYADQWLPIPKVVVFAGHMVDSPTRPQPRFPAEATGAAKRAIKGWLRRENALLGYSSAACGGDILFQEAVNSCDGETHVVLPFEPQAFVRESVAFAGGNWTRRFHDVMKHATSVVYASDQKMEFGTVSYDYANLLVNGIARTRAQELGTELVGLAVWNGKPGDGAGGTEDIVKLWRTHGMRFGQVDLAQLPAPKSVKRLPVITETPRRTRRRVRCTIGEDNHRVMALLFADVVNFSKLTERQVPIFFREFLGRIAELINQKYRRSNVARDTWGDALYLAFRSIREAGNCALDMRDMIRNTSWSRHDLPPDLNIRTALHAGPVFLGVDPVTKRPNWRGTHTSRAARLEPRTAHGEVYASEAFAALANLEQISDFRCKYVKQLDWAKHYGTFPTYVLYR